jgi:serine/threonine protein kinase
MPVATSADLLDLLQRHRILEPSQLTELERTPTADARSLARELVRRAWLTTYQVNELLQGRGRGLLLGSYLLLDKLGEGGMGAVFRARHSRLGRIVALKVIRPERLDSELAIKRFRREIITAAQLDHPNVVRAYDADEAGGVHFFAMEHVEGTDLAKLVKQHGPLPVSRACGYIRQAACGLAHAHEKGLVHRDIKPANLLLSSSGVVKVLDMGLARLNALAAAGEATTLTQDGAIMGTPDYIAPEQARDSKRADIRADLYSLGCTLYHLLSGRVPFGGGTLTEKLLAHQMDPVPDVRRLRPDVPPAVAVIVSKLMAKRPEDRYQTPGELVAAIDNVLNAAPGAAPTADLDRTVPAEPENPFADIDQATADTSAALTPPERRTRQAPARWLVWIAAGGSTLLLCSAIGLAIWLGARRSSDVAGAGQTRPATEGKGKDKAGDLRKAADTVLLFNGKDFAGWRPLSGNQIAGWQIGVGRLPERWAGLQVEPGRSDYINVATGTDLVSTLEFGDCLIEAEVLVGRGANSGIYLMGEYEIQIFDSFGKAVPGPGDMGALYGITPPRVNACKKAGEWQTLTIDFRAPRFDGNRKTANARLVRAVLNGQLIHENADVPRPTEQGLTGAEHPTGPIRLQGNLGGGVAYRNLRITPVQP